MPPESGAPHLTVNTRLRRTIATALEEDAAGLDPSAAVFPDDHASTARVVAREPMVVAGQPLLRAVYDQLDGDVTYESRIDEATRQDSGTVLGELRGPTRSLLQGERTALNFLQRACGVATKSAAYAAELADSDTSIVDTRKTLPGFRELDKYAVRCGGGSNHRPNLSGGVIVKDNHIAAAGGIRPAVRAVREAAPHLVDIEVEVEDLDAVEEALDAGADAVMLDNMSTDSMRRAVDRIRERAGDSVVVEASGNVTLERLPELADIGLDLISSGALTHSVEAADVSMQFRERS